MSDLITSAHKLVVTCSDEEEGILDYDIIHPDECEMISEPRQYWIDGEWVETKDPLDVYEGYTCVVQHCIDNCGIDELREQITNDGMSGYPEEGTYEFVGYSHYTPSTPWNGGEEWDVGLELC